MHRKFKKPCFLGFQDLNNALKKEKKSRLKPRIAQPISADLYFSTYFVVVFHLGEIVLFKTEEKN